MSNAQLLLILAVMCFSKVVPKPLLACWGIVFCLGVFAIKAGWL